MLLRDQQVIYKLLSECHELLALKEGYTLERFLGDERTKRAICMTLLNIGELVKTLSNDLRNKYSIIPWKLIAGFRGVAAHHYQTLQMEDVWKTTEEDIPAFFENLKNRKRHYPRLDRDAFVDS